MPSFFILTLRRLALLVAGLIALLPQAQAASVAAGATVYATCANCHGDAAAPAVPAVLQARNAPGVLQAAIAANRGGMGLLNLTAAQIADVAAFLGNTPAGLNFPATTVGQASGGMSITVRASNQLALNGITVNFTGDFRRSGGTCADTLPAGANCTVDVQFAPTAAGNRAGNVQIVHNGIPAGVDFALAGTGNAAAAPALAIDAANLAFPAQLVATTSNAQTLTVRNNGGAALNFTAIALAGAAAADYTLSGNCAVATPVAPAAQCSIGVAFRPGAEGARAATLNITSNGGDATLPITGTGTVQASPAVRFGAEALAFGNQTVGVASAPQNVTLTNTGNAALNITSLQAGAPFAVSGNNCGASLAAQASCSVQVTFTPAATGPVSGSVTLVSNAAGSPHRLGLSGTGLASAPQLVSSAETIDFGTRSGATVAIQPSEITLRNRGPGGLVISEFRITGAQAADFVVVNRVSAIGPTCRTGETLAAEATCVVSVEYVPRAVGQSRATLDVVSNGGSAGAVALSGVLSAAPAPVLDLSGTSLEFVRPATGGNVSQLLTLSNSGVANLRVDTLAVSAGFTVRGGGTRPCDNGTGGFTVAPGASCQVEIAWEGNAASADASLTITSDASATPQVVALTGRTQGAAGLNEGGGGCTMGQGTGTRDPVLWLMALAAAMLLWRRARGRKVRGALS